MENIGFTIEDIERAIADRRRDAIKRAVEGRPKRVSKGYRPKMLPTIALCMDQGPKGPFGEFMWRLNVTDNPRGRFVSIARRDPVLLALDISIDGIVEQLRNKYVEHEAEWIKIFRRYCNVRGIVYRMEQRKEPC